MDDELSRAAFHESGHAVAIVAAFRDAAWLPKPAPEVLVRYVEITEDTTPGQWTGIAAGTSIYSTTWPEHRIAPRYVNLMRAQVCVHLAGSIAEACHRGERRRKEILAFAKAHCHLDADLQLATGVLADLRRLRRYDEQAIIDHTLATMLAYWPAVEAVAQALVENKRIEGGEVERIIDAAL